MSNNITATFTSGPIISASLESGRTISATGYPQGPSTITTNTSTNLTGLIYGDGLNITTIPLYIGYDANSNDSVAGYDSDASLWIPSKLNFGYGDNYGSLVVSSLPTGPESVTWTLPNVSGTLANNNTAVMLTGSQNISGAKTFSSSIIGNGTSNLFSNEAGSSPHSLLTQQQLMLNGHKFRQSVCVNTKKAGVLTATIAEPFQVLGMKVSIGNSFTQATATYTLDGLFCTDVSTSTLPINNEIDAYFHGVAMQFLPESTWKARINFGVAYSRAIPWANQSPAGGSQQWGVEFSHNGTNFVGRLYFLYDPPIQYGSYFNLPLYTGSNHLSWGGFIYSIRMRQVVIGTNKLRLEFYMNNSTSNSGGTQLSKTTPLSVLETPTITTPNYRFDGKHINFEVASNALGVGSPPSGQIRMQCTNTYSQYT